MAGNAKNSRNMKKRKKKRGAIDVILTVVLVVALGIFSFAAYNLVHIYLEYKAGTDEYNEIADMAVTEQVEEEQGPGELQMVPMEVLKAPLTVDFKALKEVNDDVIGWIYVEALSDTINYPVVRGRDNDEYLHTTYNHNYNFAGTIFVDCSNSIDFSDCNTLIYGHNMKNGSMFGLLKKFVQDPELYKKSKYFWILTPTKNYRYEIIAAYTTSVNSDTYTMFDIPGTEFETYLQNIARRSEIATTPGTMDKNDRIVTLSTCTGDYSTRFVVQGKRVDILDAEK